MTNHECQFPFDESDYGREVECRPWNGAPGCGRRMKVVMIEEGELALQEVK
jgi:hypothetical protein